MRPPADATLLAAVAQVEPVLREHAGESEHARRPSKVALDALAEAGLFRLLTPRALGGLEADPLTVAAVIEATARIDSTAGWALMSGNSVDWWFARLPAEGAAEIYADDPDAITAAAFHPPMQAVEVPGGYRITGRTPLASNVSDSTWICVTALVVDGDEPRMVDGNPVGISIVARTAEIEIVDTWYPLGMRGTDSNDVVFDGVFVPTARSFPLAPAFEPGPAYRGPLYRLTGMGEVAVVGPPVCLGIARRGLDAAWELATTKTPFGTASRLAQRAPAQAGLARAEAALRAGRALLYDALGEAWDRAQAGEEFTLEQRADLLLACAQAVAASVEAVELAFRVAGTTGLYEGSPIEGAFRDLQTLRHHGFMSESRFETAGQVYLGQTPEFGLVAF